MENLININSDILAESSDNLHKNEEPFQPITYKRKTKNKEPKVRGVAEISKDDEINGFLGREISEKKIWLFVGKVKDHVTEDLVKKYLQKKTNPENNIYVREIDTYKKIKDNKCFKVGINYDLKDEAYTSSFWPRGVAVHRFDFRKEEKYINRLSNNKNTVENFQKDPQDQNLI